MAVTFTSVGYYEDISEAQWPLIASLLGSPHTVGGPADLAVTVKSDADRTVNVAAGVAFGHGVRDTTAGGTYQLPTVASGAAWFMVLVRRKWLAGNRVTAVADLPCGATPAVPATLLHQPGTGEGDDQPLAFVQVTAGQQVPTSVINLRRWRGSTYYVDDLRAAVFPQLGDRYVIPNGDRYVGVMSQAGTVSLVKEKEPAPPVIPPAPRVATGALSSLSFDASGVAVINHNLGWVPEFFYAYDGWVSGVAQDQVLMTAMVGAFMTATQARVVGTVAATNTRYVNKGLSQVRWIAGAI